MGEIRVNLTNFVAIGLMAFVFIYAASKLLPKVGINPPQL